MKKHMKVKKDVIEMVINYILLELVTCMMSWIARKFHWELLKKVKYIETLNRFFKENEDIDTVIGHSAGGSAVLGIRTELSRKQNNTYNI